MAADTMIVTATDTDIADGIIVRACRWEYDRQHGQRERSLEHRARDSDAVKVAR